MRISLVYVRCLRFAQPISIAGKPLQNQRAFYVISFVDADGFYGLFIVFPEAIETQVIDRFVNHLMQLVFQPQILSFIYFALKHRVLNALSIV